MNELIDGLSPAVYQAIAVALAAMALVAAVADRSGTLAFVAAAVVALLLSVLKSRTTEQSATHRHADA